MESCRKVAEQLVERPTSEEDGPEVRAFDHWIGSLDVGHLNGFWPWSGKFDQLNQMSTLNELPFKRPTAQRLMKWDAPLPGEEKVSNARVREWGWHIRGALWTWTILHKSWVDLAFLARLVIFWITDSWVECLRGGGGGGRFTNFPFGNRQFNSSLPGPVVDWRGYQVWNKIAGCPQSCSFAAVQFLWHSRESCTEWQGSILPVLSGDWCWAMLYACLCPRPSPLIAWARHALPRLTLEISTWWRSESNFGARTGPPARLILQHSRCDLGMWIPVIGLPVFRTSLRHLVRGRRCSDHERRPEVQTAWTARWSVFDGRTQGSAKSEDT